MDILDQVIDLFNNHGGSLYFGEQVTETEHALQCAFLAEQAGAGIGIDCLNAVLAEATQAKRVRAIQSAVLDLQRLAHPRRAAAGFSVALVNVLERGLGLSK